MQNLPLRDIHLPDPIGFWPLAPGWWMMIALIFLIALACLIGLRLRPSPLVRQGLQELAHIERWVELAPEESVRHLSILLRRVCLSRYSRETVASLTGEAWLALLDESLSEPRFATGPGHYLVDAPYMPKPPIRAEDIRPLLALCRLWLKSQRQPWKTRR